jgi:hypothetical protein
MSLKLSKKDQFRKTEFLAHAREKYTVVCARIDAFNAMMEAARESIEEANREYCASVVQLQQFAEAKAEEQASSLASKTDRWKAGEQGETARDWIDAYQAFKPEVPAIELPQEIEHPDDDLLSGFEELPDAP